MFGRWRRNDGFKWVSYVPTQIVMRRKARKERLQQAAANAREAAQQAARKSAAGLEQGVAQAGQAVVAGGGHLALAAGQGLVRIHRQLGVLVHAVRGVGTEGATRLLAGLGALVLTGVGLRAAWTGLAYGLDRPGRIALVAAVAALLAAAAPWLWRTISPTLAGLALEALRTRRVGPGRAAGEPAALRAGTLAVAVALGASALGAAGWGAWKVTAAVLGSGPPVVGIARVTGTQSVRIGDAEIRLAGIAAPEASQTCGEGSRRWRCGEDARRALIKLAAGKSLTCQIQGQDEARRRLAQCFDAANDLGAALVKGGHVWADQADGLGYRALEEAPRAAKTGIWKAASVPPWVYRERLWADAQRTAPDGCPIKVEVGKVEVGKVESNRPETSAGEPGKVAGTYHLPWDETYQRLRITKSDLARGTRLWVCSEAEALAAGFKPVSGVR